MGEGQGWGCRNSAAGCLSQRDFRLVQGVMIPFVVETAVEGYRETHKMLIEKVTLNQKLDDAVFGKPAA